MSPLRWIPTLLLGAAIGVSTVIACGDDAPGAADAATCDCPAAEPPLAGRITRVTEIVPITANLGGVGIAVCPTGAVLLGGGCSVDAPVGPHMLAEAGPRDFSGGSSGYACSWRSTAAVDTEGRISAICLLPAP